MDGAPMTTTEQASPLSERTTLRSVLDSARLRGLVIDANDGIIATAGIVEGFIGAGASVNGIVIAASAAMVAGSIALGGTKYAVEAAERDARLAIIEEERRQLALSPRDEFQELAALYEAKGLSPHLAHQVAVELTERNALEAHIEAEFGLELEEHRFHSIIIAVTAGIAFALGSLVVMLTVLVTPRNWQLPSSFIAVVVSLCLTSIILARWGRTSVLRTLARTLGVGVGAMTITYLIGTLFEL